MDNRMIIYVSSPKSYSDVFDIYYIAKEKYWKDCQFPFFFSTNCYNEKYEKIIKYCSNNIDDDWVNRTLASLKIINSKYILLMCDDIFLSCRPNVDEINNVLNVMDINNYVYCRLSPSKTRKKIDKTIGFLSNRIPYAFNLQIGIYEREFLLNILASNIEQNAWKIENFLNAKQYCEKKGYYSNAITVTKFIIPYIHGVYKGKWFQSALKKLRKRDIIVNPIKRPIVSKKTEFYICIKSLIGRLVPFKIRRKLKKILAKIGFKFAINT